MSTLSQLLSRSGMALLCFLLTAAITQVLSQRRYARDAQQLIAYGRPTRPALRVGYSGRLVNSTTHQLKGYSLDTKPVEPHRSAVSNGIVLYE